MGWTDSSAGCSERPSSEAAGKSKPEAYPQGYVEDFDEPRTKLADFINSLLEVHPELSIGPILIGAGAQVLLDIVAGEEVPIACLER